MAVCLMLVHHFLHCSDSGDEHNSQLEGELSGSFINDGAYTQVEDSGDRGRGRRGRAGMELEMGGLAFYRQVDGTPSQVSAVKYRFRGGGRKVPIMRRLHAPSPSPGGSGGAGDEYEEDSFLVGEEQEQEPGGGSSLDESTASSSSQLLLELDNDSSFEL